MDLNRRAILALALVVIVAVGTSGLAIGAAPSVDSETTDTATTSELNDGNTITYNASTNTTLQYSADSANSSVEILQNGTTLETFENTSDPPEFEVTDATNDYINFTIADDETGYSGVEAGAGENVTLTYRLINDSELDNPDTNNVTVFWENHANKSFIRGDSGDTETDEPGFSLTAAAPLIGEDNRTDPAKVEQDIGVAGSDQDEITVYVETTDGEDALSDTYDAADEAGTVTYDGWVTLEGDFVPVLASEDDAPDWLETDTDTYATVSEDGSEVVIHNAGTSLGEDTENATVQVVGSEEMGIFEIAGMLDEYGASTLTKWRAATNGEGPFGDDQFEVAS